MKSKQKLRYICIYRFFFVLLRREVLFIHTRISLKTALEGGISDPRNATLTKMSSLIGIGERAGSGIPSIISVWSDAMGIVPTYKQSFAPERVQFVIDVNGNTVDKFLANNGDVTPTRKALEKIMEKTTEKTT